MEKGRLKNTARADHEVEKDADENLITLRALVKVTILLVLVNLGFKYILTD